MRALEWGAAGLGCNRTYTHQLHCANSFANATMQDAFQFDRRQDAWIDYLNF